MPMHAPAAQKVHSLFVDWHAPAALKLISHLNNNHRLYKRLPALPELAAATAARSHAILNSPFLQDALLAEPFTGYHSHRLLSWLCVSICLPCQSLQLLQEATKNCLLAEPVSVHHSHTQDAILALREHLFALSELAAAARGH